MSRNPIVYIRRRTDIKDEVWFDIVERQGARFESKIYPVAVDIAFLEMAQRNGCVLVDADMIVREQVVGN